MAIVLLKPTLIDNAYELLANQYLKMKLLKQFRVQLTKFMLYFHQQWMKFENRPMISFYEVDFKTNNWSESNFRLRTTIVRIFFCYFRLQCSTKTTSTTKSFIHLDINRTSDYRGNCSANEIFSNVKWLKKVY
jgi:hypothetical protein